MIFFITNLKLNHIYLNDNHMKIKTFQSHKNNDNLLNLAFVTTISAHRLAAFKSLEPTLHIQPTIRSPPETQTFPTVLTTVSAVAVQEIAKIVPTSSSNILHYSSAEALSVIPLGRTASRGMSWWWTTGWPAGPDPEGVVVVTWTALGHASTGPYECPTRRFTTPVKMVWGVM